MQMFVSFGIRIFGVEELMILNYSSGEKLLKLFVKRIVQSMVRRHEQSLSVECEPLLENSFAEFSLTRILRKAKQSFRKEFVLHLQMNFRVSLPKQC